MVTKQLMQFIIHRLKIMWLPHKNELRVRVVLQNCTKITNEVFLIISLICTLELSCRYICIHIWTFKHYYKVILKCVKKCDIQHCFRTYTYTNDALFSNRCRFHFFRYFIKDKNAKNRLFHSTPKASFVVFNLRLFLLYIYMYKSKVHTIAASLEKKT